MKIEYIGENAAGITLSRRNLLTLLAKLDGHPPDSFCTISKTERTQDVKRPLLHVEVRAEADDEHYNSAKRDPAVRGQAGRMHPDTEQAIRAKT